MTDTARHPLAEQLRACLPPAVAARYDVCAVDETVSTNTDLKHLAAAVTGRGEKIRPTLLLARTQSGGRGRMGRSFHSPVGTGLYMSILLAPAMPAREALLLTTAAAVACAEGADAVLADMHKCGCGGEPARVGIKWVNDLYLQGKKICGILAEASLSADAGALAWAVIGMGINLTPPDGGFPEALSHTAGALLTGIPADADALLCRLGADILVRLDRYLTAEVRPYVLDAYRSRSILDGRAVTVRPMSSLGGEERPAVVRGIDDDFGLRVVYEDGEETTLSSGEVVMRDGDGILQSARASVHLR